MAVHRDANGYAAHQRSACPPRPQCPLSDGSKFRLWRDSDFPRCLHPGRYQIQSGLPEL